MEMNSSLNSVGNVSHVIEVDDPNILATSFMMYKVGKFSNSIKTNESLRKNMYPHPSIHELLGNYF